MKRIFLLVCFFSAVICLSGIASADPFQYTFQGTLGYLDDPYGIATGQGVNAGDTITYILKIDFDELGTITLNNGEVTQPWPIYFYADFIGGTDILPVDGGFNNDPTHAAEYNYGYDSLLDTGEYRSNIYVKSVNDHIHFYRKNSPLPMREWEEGEKLSAYARISDSLGNVVSVDVHGAFIDIKPVPEPSTILLLSSGLIGLVGVIRKYNKKKKQLK